MLRFRLFYPVALSMLRESQLPKLQLLILSIDPYVQTFWPPRDPTRDIDPHKPDKPTRAQKRFKLPDSPWTYGGNGFNPDLLPTNTGLRQRNAKPNAGESDEDIGRHSAQAESFPPYHPSYRTGTQAPRKQSSSPEPSQEVSDNSVDDFEPMVRPDASTRVKTRLGSEGWEVRPPSYGSNADTAYDSSDVDAVQRREGVPQTSNNLLPPPDRYRRYVSDDSSSEGSEGSSDY